MTTSHLGRAGLLKAAAQRSGLHLKEEGTSVRDG